MGKVEELKIDDDVRVESEPLPYEKAEDLLPDVAQIISRGFDQISPELAKMIGEFGDLDTKDPRMAILLLPAVSGVIQQLGGGKLKTLVPKLLLTTTVYITTNGEIEKFDMSSKERRAACFDVRPDIYLQTLWHAGKVTFARFFPGAGRRAKSKSATETASS